MVPDFRFGASNHVESSPIQGIPQDEGWALDVEWLTPKRCRARLNEVATQWQMAATQQGCRDSLGQIQIEVWSALQACQPFPHIALVTDLALRPHGVISGYRHPGLGCFFIQSFAMAIDWTTENGEQVSHKLVDAAIDASHGMGYHGWVACVPKAEETRFWNSLGFFKHDEYTYRRMGYFS